MQDTGEREIRNIEHDAHFVLCDVGDVVEVSGKVGVYVGDSSVDCCSVGGQLISTPVVVYPGDKVGEIKREHIFFLEPPQPGRITAYSGVNTLDASDSRFDHYQSLLEVL